MVLKQFLTTITRNGNIFSSYGGGENIDSAIIPNNQLLKLLKGQSEIDGQGTWRFLGAYKDSETTPYTYSMIGAPTTALEESVNFTRNENDIVNARFISRNTGNANLVINKIIGYVVFYTTSPNAFRVIQLIEIPLDEPMTLAPGERIQIDYRLAMN